MKLLFENWRKYLNEADQRLFWAKNEGDLYRELNYNPEVHKDLKKAYRDRAKETHPDRIGGDIEAFKKVQDAYEALTVPGYTYADGTPTPGAQPSPGPTADPGGVDLGQAMRNWQAAEKAREEKADKDAADFIDMYWKHQGLR